MKKSKIILSAIFWPVLLGIGQFAISFLFFFLFAKKNPTLKGQALTQAFLPYMEKYIWVPILFNLIVLFPFFIHQYKKYASLKKKLQNKDIQSILFLSLPLCLAFNLLLSIGKEVQMHISFSFLLFFSTSILGPILEELAFRGIAYEEMKKIVTKKTAMIIVTLFFAGYHQGFFQIFYAACMGILFMFLREKYQNIKASMWSHISVNAFAYFFSFMLPIIPIFYKYIFGSLFLVLFALILRNQLKNT